MDASNRNSCIILGCGRSGTSMVAGCIASAGYFCGSELLAADPSNPKGYYEDREVNAINEALLASHFERRRGRLWAYITQHKAPRGARWLVRIRDSVSGRVSADIAARIEQQTDQEPFCFKDPRFCYTLPAWRPFLPECCRFIVVYRDPLRTAHSIMKRAAGRPYGKKFKLDLRRAGDIWYRAYRSVIRQMDDRSRFLVIHYDRVLNGSSIPAIESFLEVRINSEFADPTVGRSFDIPEVAMPKRWSRLYLELEELEAASHSAVLTDRSESAVIADSA